MATTLYKLVLLTAAFSAVAAITMPVRRQPPMRQIHRFGTVPQVIRVRGSPVRGGPVKRIYVPMNVLPPQHQRYVPSYEPAHWKPKPMMKMYQHGPQAPNRILPQAWQGPMRKARNPKPKFSRKPVYKFPPKSAPAYDSYRPQPAYHGPPALTDSYTPQKTSYQLTAPTYGKPHPAGSPEPPKDKITEDPPTSYMHVYQGDKATKEGKPTYGYTQSHTTFEDTSKTSSSKTTNHRPVYKPKSDTTEDPQQGSFQPPKQTFGFTPYEDSLKESSESYPPNYYKKQPDTVLSPNYFDQNKS